MRLEQAAIARGKVDSTVFSRYESAPRKELSGWLRRALAYLLDGVLLLVAFFVALYAGSQALPGQVEFVALGLVLLTLVYAVLLEGSESGQTLGKQIAGTQGAFVPVRYGRD